MKYITYIITLFVSFNSYANYKYSGAGTSQIEGDNQDSSRVVYEANFVFQYGGESKLTLLPKVNLLRKHNLKLFNPYYGFEFGVHPLLIAGSFSVSGICGLEKSFIILETSVSHYRTNKISDGEDGYMGPFSQNLLNTKLGIRIKGVKLKIGTSFLLNENIPQGQERIPLLDVGKINGNIYGIELQFKIK